MENHGNGLANCRLHLVDPTGRVDGQFDPPAVGVAPGASSLVHLRARAKGLAFRPTERQLDIEIEAAEPDHAPATGRATLIQSPTVPARTLGQLAWLALALGLLAAAWFTVVRPELRDAAEGAVDDRISELDGAPGGAQPEAGPTEASVPGEAPPPASVAPPVVVQPSAVDYTWYRIAVEANIGQERRNSASVPAEAAFQLTDIVLQNPHGDLGTATLLRGDEVVYEWDLGAMNNANEFQPRISPLEFEPGESLVLSVDCDGSGSSEGTGCSVALLLTGVLVPAAGPAGG